MAETGENGFLDGFEQFCADREKWIGVQDALRDLYQDALGRGMPREMLSSFLMDAARDAAKDEAVFVEVVKRCFASWGIERP